MRAARIIPLLALIALLALPVQFLGVNPQAELVNTPVDQTGIRSNKLNRGMDENGVKSVVTSQDSQISGVFDPVLVETCGYYSSGTSSTITAPWFNETLQLPIDTANNWRASLAEVDVWNLERMYAVNGSFDEGIAGQNLNPSGSVTNYPYGWDAYSYDSGTGQTQVASYVSGDSDYIVLENQGEKKGSSGVQYDHYGGTWISWNQTIENTPKMDNFTLDFRFLYERGPLEKPGGQNLIGNCSIAVQVNGSTIWSRSLPYIDSRGVWYETGDIPINLTQIGNYDLSVSLVIDELLDLNAEDDLDNDGFNDGSANVVYVTVHVDDIRLTGISPPSCESVDLQFEANSSSNPITGTGGSGNASVLANDYWTESPVNFTLLSNVSTEYDYEVRLLSHKFTNTSWEQDISSIGVRYDVSTDESAELNFFTYVGSEDDYVDLVIDFYYPTDWDNVTVYDPFLNNVTDQCTISEGSIEVPTSLLSRNGWWRATLYSPNYLNASQMEESVSETWTANDIFLPGAEARVSLSIGTATETPVVVDPVNVTWNYPNGTVWSFEAITDTLAGKANSSSLVLAGTNTSAGQWSIDILWVNGTEVAYSAVPFDMYHYSTVSPVYSHIDADVGDLISNFVYMSDSDTGEYLLDDSVNIEANWSGSTVIFTQDLVKNWWEGDFDTNLLGGGSFFVQVNASRPYYTDSITNFTIVANYTTTLGLEGITGDIETISLGEKLTLSLRYERSDTTGIAGATVSNEYSGPTDGLTVTDSTGLEDGNYTVEITADIAGTYSVTLTTSAEFHYASSVTFTLIVGEKAAELDQLNGTTDLVRFGEDYRYVFLYKNGSGSGLEKANITLVSSSPETGITVNSYIEHGDGFYSILIEPQTADTFSFIFKANLTNYETEFASFTLVVSELPTILTISGGSDTIPVDDSTTIQLYLEDDASNPITGATIVVIDPDPNLSFSPVDDLITGEYNITVSPSHTGTYSIAFLAYLDNYQNSTTGFVLLVTANSAVLEQLNGTSGETVFGGSYTYVLRYTDGSNNGLLGANASVVSISPASGIDWTASDDLDGYYSIFLTPLFADTFTIVLRANLTDYETEFATFTLVVSEVPTILTINGGSSETIAIDQTFTLQLLFTDESLNALAGATISILDPPESLAFSDVDIIDDGMFNVTITPSKTGTFVIAFRASLTNYRNASVGFNLLVTSVPTELVIIEGSLEAEVDYMETYLLILGYERTDTDQNISSAVIDIYSDNLEGITHRINESEGLYHITLRASLTRTFSITISASKDGHDTHSISIILGVNEIETDSIPDISLDEIVYGRSYDFVIEFMMSSNDSLVDNASVLFLGDSTDWFTLEPLENKTYLVSFTPIAIGRYQTTIRLERDGFETQSFTIDFTVIEVPIEVVLQSSLSWLERDTSQFKIQVVESDTGLPVSGATVRYGLSVNGQEATQLYEMTDEGNGTYSDTYTMPFAEGGETYTLRFYIDKDFHNLDSEFFEENLVPQYNQPARALSTIFTFSPVIILSIGLPIGLFVAYRVFDKRRKAEIIRDQAVKRRFDDVRNLIGILVLHRSSGLPVYSRFLREGFDESMISAFITAVTQFRMEVERNGDIPERTLLPISDIIRVMYTDSLVCAFITVGSPSVAHIERMVEFGKTIGEKYDAMFEATPTEVLDYETEEEIDDLFDDMLDGALLKDYKLMPDTDLPRGMRYLELGVMSMNPETIDLPELAHEMTMQGVAESRAYRIILDAINQQIICPVEEPDEEY